MAKKPSYTPRQIGSDTDTIPPIGTGKIQGSTDKWELPDYAAKRNGADDYMQIPSMWQGKTHPYRAGYTSAGASAPLQAANPKQYKFGAKTI